MIRIVYHIQNGTANIIYSYRSLKAVCKASSREGEKGRVLRKRRLR